MSPRLLLDTKWLCCLMVVSGIPSWRPVNAIAVKNVKNPPQGPATVEAQAKFFQYRHLPTHEDYDQGHRQGSEKHFTERHERARPGDGLFSAKVRWGDKKGGYGEHYWDLNHAGHVGNHGSDDDDGSYNSHENTHDHDPYDEPSQHIPSYNDEYDAEKSARSPFDDGTETNRAKRAQPRTKPDKDGEIIYGKRKTKDLYITRGTNNKKKEESDESDESEEEAPQQKYVAESEERKPEKRYRKKTKEVTNKPAQQSRYHHHPKELNYDDDNQNPNEPSQVGLPDSESQENYTEEPEAPLAPEPRYKTSQKTYAEEPAPQLAPETRYKVSQPTYTEQPEPQLAPEARYVPYEGGAGIRHYQQPALAASAPRLFLDPATGNVVDRITGQAYYLQPILAHH